MAPRHFALLVLMCLVWAINNLVSKHVISGMDVPPLFYAAARFAILTVVLIPFLAPAPRPISRLVITALLMGGGNFGLMFVGLQTSTPSSVAVVFQLGLPMTTLLSVLMLGERITPWRGLGIALSFAGVLMVIWDPAGLTVSTGLLLVALATFMSSLGAVMTKQIEGLRPLTFQAWVGLSSLFPLAALSAWLEPGQIDLALAAGWPFVAALLFSAFIVSLGAHTSYVMLLQKYEANLIAALTLMTPLMTIGLGVALLGDPFGPRMALGAAVAMTGVLIVALRRNQVLALLMAVRNRVR
ncbi:DMT family transporter [Phenylobacterium sp.]|jgi:O-acetylserine/cysteine efflux transporter|uniref:DMT family transporter n=1 Tax=Phenylobacterium sp. TaxID=1871053 RepID=UPI0037CAAD45